jgi:hypothetical protein
MEMLYQAWRGDPPARVPPASDYLSCVFLEIKMSDLVSKVGLGSVFCFTFSNVLSGEWRVLRVERSATRPLKMLGLVFCSYRKDAHEVYRRGVGLVVASKLIS